MGKSYWFVMVTGCFLLSGFRVAPAQVPRHLDSLAQHLTSTRRDTTYVNALNEYGWALVFEKAAYDSTIRLARRAEALALKLHYGTGVYTAHRNIGGAYYHKGNTTQALHYFQESVADVARYGLSKQTQVTAIGNVALAYSNLNQPQKAMDIALAAIRLQEASRLPQATVSQIYSLVGKLLKKMGQPAQALQYYHQSIAIALADRDYRRVAIAENHVGNIYDDLAKPKQALKSYQSCLKRAESIGYELLQVDALQNIGRMYDQLGQPAKGLPYLFKAVKIARKQGVEGSQATANYNIGGVYQTLRVYPDAERYCLKALALAQKMHDNERIQTYEQGIAGLYAEQKKYAQAYNLLARRIAFTDSSTTVQARVEVQGLVARYETEKKEARLRLMQKEAQLRQYELERSQLRANILLAGGLLLLLLGGAVSAWLLNRARLRRLEDAQRLRKQIAHDLHDEVGSTLSSISLLSGMVNDLFEQHRPEQEATGTAQRMVQKIYGDARQILESIDEIIWTINPGNDSLQRIMLRLQEYAQPLMESKNIHFSFVTDPALATLPVSMELRRNLYLIGKEAINNLVKYAHATKAMVRFERQGGQLMVLIEDNGQGFDPSLPTSRTGQASMQERAKAMSGSLQVLSERGEGTTMRLSVPIEP